MSNNDFKYEYPIEYPFNNKFIKPEIKTPDDIINPMSLSEIYATLYVNIARKQPFPVLLLLLRAIGRFIKGIIGANIKYFQRCFAFEFYKYKG